jgi:hypothetical protein
MCHDRTDREVEKQRKTTTKSLKDAQLDSGEDLDTTGSFLACANCERLIKNWQSTPAYLCFYCTELTLCAKCYDEKLARESGQMEPDWRILCAKDHRHVRAPVDGWRGVKDGVLRLANGKEIKFSDWLVDLKDDKWPEAWNRFWDGV